MQIELDALTNHQFCFYRFFMHLYLSGGMKHVHVFIDYALNLILYQQIGIKAVYVKLHFYERSTNCTSTLRRLNLKLIFIIFTTQLM